MLNTALRFINPGNKQTIVEWSRYISILELRTGIYKTRFLMGSYFHSKFVNLMTQLLYNIDLTNILKIKSDFQRYAKFIDPAASIFRNVFDPVLNAKDISGIIVNKPSKDQDFFCCVSCDKPLSKLPLEKGWSAWENTKPITIVHHNINELITNFQFFNIDFKRTEPAQVIVAIDIVMLIFKYVKYYEYCRERGEECKVETFIHQHIVAQWFDDTRRIWLFNILTELFFGNFSFDRITSDQTIAPDNALKNALQDVHRKRYELHQKNIEIGDFLSTDWLGISLYSWFTHVRDNLQLPMLQQYKWLKFMEEYPYVKFLILVSNAASTAESVLINKELIALINRYNDSNIYINITNAQLREQVKQDVNNILVLVKSNKYL